ncbi:MAG: glycosyltransferase [Parvularculaceae bacterium]
MIPNRIHFIFGLKPDFGGKPFSYVHYLAVKSAAAVNRPDEIIMHAAHEPAGPWWEAAKPLFILNRVTPPDEIFGRVLTSFAHKADALRMQILAAEGGIYLDLDTFCVNSFAPLRGHDAVLGREPGAGLCNAVMLASPKSDFITQWLEQYRSFDSAVWNRHSVQLPFRLAQAAPHAIHVVDEFSFFFPHFSDPKSDWLWRKEIPATAWARGLARGCRHALRALAGDATYRSGPSLRSGLGSRDWYQRRMREAYCLHLWESLWWEPRLKTLSPETLRASSGLFAALVKTVLPDEIR